MMISPVYDGAKGGEPGEKRIRKKKIKKERSALGDHSNVPIGAIKSKPNPIRMRVIYVR